MTDLDIVRELKAANRHAWMRLLKSTKETSKQLKNVESNINPKSFLAHSSKLTVAGDKNWLAVGDAFSSHDPLSSSGIPHALGSGAFAGRVVVSSLMGNDNLLQDYSNEISNQYLIYLLLFFLLLWCYLEISFLNQLTFLRVLENFQLILK